VFFLKSRARTIRSSTPPPIRDSSWSHISCPQTLAVDVDVPSVVWRLEQFAKSLDSSGGLFPTHLTTTSTANRLRAATSDPLPLSNSIFGYPTILPRDSFDAFFHLLCMDLSTISSLAGANSSSPVIQRLSEGIKLGAHIVPTVAT